MQGKLEVLSSNNKKRVVVANLINLPFSYKKKKTYAINVKPEIKLCKIIINENKLE